MNPSELPPNVAVFQIASAAMASQALWVVAELGVADHVPDEGLDVPAIARAAGADPDTLYRVMRLLASMGVFHERDGQQFGHTPLSQTLRSDHPARARAAVRLIAMPPFWKAMGDLEHSVRTGEPAWSKSHGMSVFDYLGQHPEEAALFNDAMIGIHGSEPPAVAEAYDFSGMKTVVDVGGGTGNLLIHILRRHEHLSGILFDLPQAAEPARERLAAEGLAQRCRVEPGSFFEKVPTGADAYLLSHVIHDWDEATCLRILSTCRLAIKGDAKLLLVEMVVPGPNQPHPAKALDLVMLTIPGGRERTAAEYGDLLGQAGLRLQRVIPTASPVSIVEAALA